MKTTIGQTVDGISNEMYKWTMKDCLFAANWLSFYAHPEEP